MKLDVLPSTCDCERCSNMCRAPCCGTPDEMLALIKAGFANRLCFDNLDFCPDDIHPALKGYEGGLASYQTYSNLGCTFWKEGKCELHSLGLKPMGGRYSHHDLSSDDWNKVVTFITKSWETKKAAKVIDIWKKLVKYNET